MAQIPVRFVYMTGLKRPIFQNVQLVGSWDASGRYSGAWSSTPMTEITGEDGCPAFEATVQLDSSQVDWWFQWGVTLDGPPGNNVWGIVTEVNDINSSQRERALKLRPAAADGSVQEERYYFTHCRRLGAQKFGADQIRFAAWAPNAQSVRLVLGTIWDRSDPTKAPLEDSLRVDQIMGGYISDGGDGVRSDLGPFPMRMPLPDGVWVTDPIDDYKRFDHRPYMYEVKNDAGRVEYRTDIHSRCQIGPGQTNPNGNPYDGRMLDLDGLVSCSVVVDPDTATQNFQEPVWPEEHFIPETDFWETAEYRVGDKVLVAANEFDPTKPVPNRVEDLIIYELHVGALGFGKKQDGQDAPGSIEDAVNFLDQLVDLGVNAVELLPLSEFGSTEANWGYSTSHYFAIEYNGGGRDKYKFFIKACHQRGIAAIMDVVYNHYNQNAERAEWMYDTDANEKNSYYWYEGHASDYPAFDQAVRAAGHPDRVGQGGYSDNMSTGFAPRYYEETVRKLFTSSAAALVEEFHVDGFRADQTTSIHQYNVRHADGAPVPSANIFGIKLLKEWSRTLRLIRPGIMLMAEDHSNWDKVTQPPDQDGLGFDAAWYADFHHHLVGQNYESNYAKLIPTAGYGNDGPLAMDWFAGALDASKYNKVVYHTSHDEAGNAGKDDPRPDFRSHRTIICAVRAQPGDVLTGDTRRYAEARCRFAFGAALLSAGTPMFLFGEEVGAQKDFIFDQVIANREDLVGLRQSTGKFLFAFYSDLIHFRLAHSGLRSRNIDILHVHNVNRVLAFRRWDDKENFLVLASLNNHPFGSGYVVQNARLPDGSWKQVFNSDSDQYGGWNVGNFGATIPSSGGSFNANIPACGFVVFQRS